MIISKPFQEVLGFLALLVIIALAIGVIARADPPTPPPKPRRWELLGTYHTGEGAGRGLTNAVIDLDSIQHDGDIYSAYIGRDCDRLGAQWTHCTFVVSYKIDCKYHTYNELWSETDLGFQRMDDEWITIEPDSDIGLGEKRLCHRQPR